MRRKLTMLGVSMLAAVGLVFTASVPAQAFGPIITTPWACWATTPYIAVQNPSNNYVSVKLYNNVDNGLIGQYTVLPGQSSNIFAWAYKSIHVVFTGPGNLNWFYQQKCL